MSDDKYDRYAKPFMQFNNLSMRCYLPSEIRKLSVAELTETKTFDEAGFPIKGGLYDAVLGPAMSQMICETCGLKGSHCPGHFGHLQLSVPVFNPLFFSFTFNLMKGTCIHCHRFTCNTGSEATVAFLKEWAALPGDLVKNNVAVKHAKMKEFLRDNLFKRRIKCPHCKCSNGILRNDAARAFILDFTTGLSAIRRGPATAAEIAKSRKARFGGAGVSKYQADEVLEASAEFEAEEDADEKSDKNANARGAVDANAILDPLALSAKILQQQLSMVVSGKCDKLIWRAAEVREHFRLLWKREGAILQYFFPVFAHDETNLHPTDMLFCQMILVQPSKFRPQRYLRGDSYEHPITANYRRVMEADQLLSVVKIVMSSGGKSTLEAKNLIENKVIGKTLNEKLHNAYLELQVRVNCLYDQGADKNNATPSPGLKQIIEKKEGLFRMNMMGKRVDYACRSVITPDPYLDVDEIGIPDLFARRLTFQEPMNFLNMAKLRERVRNGPSQHPGANFVQLQGNYKQMLPPTSQSERVAIGRRLTAGATKAAHSMPSYVFRHLEKGDHLLMNRQPSLHKPSIMGHKARILKGQKALRMNYAPCKAYNADFDGDEMNGHFLQNRVAQSEASELANVGSNYLVPKDGTPILGLIQDHVVSGVLLTMRDRFLTRSEFMQLVFSAFAETTKRIKIPPPAMLKPEVRWTGKQVVTTLMQNLIPADRPKINLSGKAKTALSNWRVPGVEADLKFAMSESEVIFREGELLCGVLDKEHYGATQYGLIHCCYELYGPKVSTSILSCFSRLFTTFLQRHGFTLGVADILVRKDGDKIRRKTIRELRKVGPAVVQKTFNLPDNATPLQIRQQLATAYNNPRRDKSDVKQLDFTMKQVMAKLCEQINNACVPKGLIRCFPDNALQLMIQSGAKGSMVNSIQISCALGQIELEGQRPPLSAVGRTLPSFRCFDPSPRAGGFVDQRFLTGLKPQELFFHTMAGREGLVDTAVKTSRSGYLQRCIIKHLEGISVRYDHTVRDHDGSVIQFRYGEDGLDVGRATFLNPRQFHFLEDNVEAIRCATVPPSTRSDASEWNVRQSEKYFKRVSKWKKARRKSMADRGSGDGGEDGVENCKVFESPFLKFCETAGGKKKSELVSEWRQLSDEGRAEFTPAIKALVDSVDVKFNPATSLGALPEKMLEEIATYLRKNDASAEFRRVMFWKGLRAYADPGENVGLLAAQSIGEPSTQMTLNTFHFAGRGEMNVTLGIPRLREILMTSGKNILTPMTEVTIRDGVTEASIEKLKRDLNPVSLKQLIKRFILEEEVTATENRLWRGYTLTIELLRNKHRESNARHVERERIIREIEKRFLREVAHGIGKRFKEVLEHQQIQHKRLRTIAKLLKSEGGAGDENDDGELLKKETNDKEAASSDDDDEGGDGGADETRLKKRHLDDAADYEGEDVEKDEVIEVGDATLNGDDDLADLKDAEGEEDGVGAQSSAKRRAAKRIKGVKLEGGGIDLLEEEDDDEDEPMELDEEDSEAELRRRKRKSAAAVENGLNGDDTKPETMDKNRVSDVLRGHPLIVDYRYDFHSDRWCSVKYQLPMKNKTKIDVMAIVETVVNKFIVTQIPGIQKAIVREDTRNGKTTKILQVQGVNIEALYSRSDILDVNTLYSNDINFMLNKYGIEACGRTIAKEMNNVFSVYGIEVNPRHLSLTADFMTFTGEVLPFSRGAMVSNASPLQKMTFETTAVFLRDAIITGQQDNLCSPSARLITGQLHRSGTGAFDLLEDPTYVIGTKRKG